MQIDAVGSIIHKLSLPLKAFIRSFIFAILVFVVITGQGGNGSSNNVA